MNQTTGSAELMFSGPFGPSIQYSINLHNNEVYVRVALRVSLRKWFNLSPICAELDVYL